MKKIITILTALIFSAVTFAQTRNLIGMVNDENGEPIVGVKVVAEGGAATATSGSDGRFEMNVPYSSRSVTASHDRYITRSVEIEGSFLVITLKLNLDAARANNKVSESVFRGLVKDEDGEPISGVTVEVNGTKYSTTTGHDGRFELKAPSNTRSLFVSGDYLVKKYVEIEDPSFIIISMQRDRRAIYNQENAARMAAEAKRQAEADSLRAIEDARMKATADSLAAVRKAEALRAQFVADSVAAARAAEQARLKAEADSIKAARIAEQARLKAEADSAKAARQAIADSIKAANAAEQARLKAIADSIKQAHKDSLKAIRLADIARNDSLYRNHGFYKAVEVGYNAQLGVAGEVIYTNYGYRSYGNTTPLDLKVVLGYRLNNAIVLGLGTGITYQMLNLGAYGDTFSKSAYGSIINYKNFDVPVYVNGQFFFTRTKIQPMLSVSGGVYLLSSTPLANAGVGVNIRVNHDSNLYVLGTVGMAPWPCFTEGAFYYTSPLAAGVKLGLAF